VSPFTAPEARVVVAVALGARSTSPTVCGSAAASGSATTTSSATGTVHLRWGLTHGRYSRDRLFFRLTSAQKLLELSTAKYTSAPTLHVLLARRHVDESKLEQQ
jgi:hypothetical protein